MWSTSVVLVLVRHGRTAANAQGLLQGRLDYPLDEVGLAQAAEVAKALGRPSRVVSSPLRRARETAEALGVDVDVDERWTELDYGELDGQPVASMGFEAWARWRDDSRFAPPGGESLSDMAARVVSACEDLRDEATEAEVVVVSHVSPIKTAMAWALGLGTELAWHSHLDQASITRISFGPRGPMLRSFNETGHLSAGLGPRLSG
jgi:broad specificity phosphatase PhoE